MANTKLTPQQKLSLKDLKIEATGRKIQILNLDNKTVMACKNHGNTVEFALSVMSPDEKKFRVKVGEYLAITKYFNGETVKMDKLDFATMCEFCWDAYPFSE